MLNRNGRFLIALSALAVLGGLFLISPSGSQAQGGREAARQTATALRATNQALRGTATRTPRPNATRLPFEEGVEAISSYAAEVLGINVEVLRATGGEGTGTRSGTPQGTPAFTEITYALRSYAGVLRNGSAALSYGSGTLSGDLTVDVQAHSFGVYTLIVPNSGQLNSDQAFKLALSTFPKLAGYTYTPIQWQGALYAWYAATSISVIDPQTRQLISQTQSVLLYISVGSSGQTLVTASVGRGQFATKRN